jgi:hypothetical protein
MKIGKEKLEFSEKNLLHRHSAHHKIHVDYSGIDVGPQR